MHAQGASQRAEPCELAEPAIVQQPECYPRERLVTHALADAADDTYLILAAELEALGKLGDLLEQDETLAGRLVRVVDGGREALDALGQVDETRCRSKRKAQACQLT